MRCPVSRDYTAPSDALSLTQLNIACSFSGNTEETLSAFLDALETGQPTIAVCTGGALEELAVQMDAPCVKLTKPTPTFQPRAATGMFIGVEIQMSFASSDIMGVGKGRELFCGWHSSRP